MTSPGLRGESRSVWDRVLPAMAIVLLTWACAMEFILPASHDELHFSHAAWLWSQGKEPYRDFFYHNTPGILYLLGAARLVLGDFGPAVLWWGRAHRPLPARGLDRGDPVCARHGYSLGQRPFVQASL